MVTSFVFIGFPMLLLGSLSWACYNIGQSVGSFVQKQSGEAQAGKAVGKVAVKSATKGKG